MNATIFVKKTVGELLFDGYQDSIIDLGATFGSMEAGFDEDKVALDKFGWFYKVTFYTISLEGIRPTEIILKIIKSFDLNCNSNQNWR